MKTAVVTGANSGLGLTLCERLLSLYPDIKLCMVCRSESRGKAARKALLHGNDGADIDLVLCDVGNLKSVRNTAAVLKEKYKHIDYLFLNAGVMPEPKVNWWSLFGTFLQPWKMVHRFTTGRELLDISDGTTEEGFKLTFATNVLGHFCLVNELGDIIGGSEFTQIIWSGSRSATSDIFSIHDIQHSQCVDPYSSSKRLIDILSLEMNEQLRTQNVYTQVICPGIVMSSLTYNILPQWFWNILIPILKFFRYMVPSFTFDTYNGCEALVWLTNQNPVQLNPHDKYYSCVNMFGSPYVSTGQINVEEGDSESVYKQLLQLLSQP